MTQSIIPELQQALEISFIQRALFELIEEKHLYTPLLVVNHHNSFLSLSNENHKVFAVGDIYKFDIEEFRGTSDTNLHMLIDFFDSLEDLMNSLANINAFTEEELEEYEEDEDNLII